MMNLDGLKDLVRRPFKNQLCEDFLYLALHSVSEGGRYAILHFVPQPRNYSAQEVRRVSRYGFELMLRPRNYFQWHHYFGLPDSDMETLEDLAGSAEVILDIGANIGLYTLVMARKNPSARIISVEPNPQALEALEDHIRINQATNVTALGVAAGQQPGRLELFEAQTGDVGKSSLREREDFHSATTVEVTTVDKLVETQRLSRVDLLKIDVESFEPEVILGARQTIQQFRPGLFVEFTPRWYGDRRELAREAVAFLGDLGYVFFGGDFRTLGTAAPRLDAGQLIEESAGQTNVVALPTS